MWKAGERNARRLSSVPRYSVESSINNLSVDLRNNDTGEVELWAVISGREDSAEALLIPFHGGYGEENAYGKDGYGYLSSDGKWDAQAGMVFIATLSVRGGIKNY